jgi:flagellar motor switch protein FliN/FliY
VRTGATDVNDNWAGDEFEQDADFNALIDNDHVNRGISPESVMDVRINASIEIGHCKIAINKLLQLNQGAVVEFDRAANKPVDVLINGRLIARGEIIVLNGKFGLRIADIISPSSRIPKTS